MLLDVFRWTWFCWCCEYLTRRGVVWCGQLLRSRNMAKFVGGVLAAAPHFLLAVASLTACRKQQEHSGSLRAGHYTAIAMNSEDKRWYSFNDSSVSETSELLRNFFFF